MNLEVPYCQTIGIIKTYSNLVSNYTFYINTDSEIEQLIQRCTRQKKRLRQRRKHKLKAKSKSVKTGDQLLHISHSKQQSSSSSLPLQVHATHINNQAPLKVHPPVATLNKSIFEQSTLQYKNQQKKFMRRLPRMVSQPINCPLETSSAPNQLTARQSWHEGISPRKSQNGIHIRQAADELCRVIKVFLSERQSSSITDMGRQIPCAPPATPMPGREEIG